MTSIVLLQRDHEASPHLRQLIDTTQAFHVAGVSHTVQEARGLIRDTRPDILVTDLRVQDGGVGELLFELRRPGTPHRPHILVTMVSHDDAVLLDALCAGADGYWVHARSSELLIDTLAQLARGESPMSPMIARQVLSHFETAAQPQASAATPPALTGTEREILQWVARGYLIDEIAQQWQASVHSLACSIRRVYNKLQFDLRARALSFA